MYSRGADKGYLVNGLTTCRINIAENNVRYIRFIRQLNDSVPKDVIFEVYSTEKISTIECRIVIP